MATEHDHNCIDDDKVIADIEQFGWSVILVEGSDYLPNFAYTVGLWKNYNHPELISFGLSSQTLHTILNTGGSMPKSGNKFSLDDLYDDFFENGPVQLLKVDRNNIADYFGYAMWFNQSKDFPALQLIWTDRNNKFPWEQNFEKEYEYRQPLLDRNMDFKFREPENLATFTTRQWIELNKPILRVAHESDGDWQFLTGDQMPEDIRVVAQKEMVLQDETLNEVFNLEYGESAEREEIGGNWVRSEVSDAED